MNPSVRVNEVMKKWLKEHNIAVEILLKMGAVGRKYKKQKQKQKT